MEAQKSIEMGGEALPYILLTEEVRKRDSYWCCLASIGNFPKLEVDPVPETDRLEVLSIYGPERLHRRIYINHGDAPDAASHASLFMSPNGRLTSS